MEKLIVKSINKSKKNKHNLIKRAEERKAVKAINTLRIDDAELEIELVHKNGFIVLAIGEPICKGDKRYNWHQWSYNKTKITDKLISNILGYNHNTYLSLNSFKSPRKTIANLYSLNALWSDIDYYKIDKYKNKSYEQMINIISKNKIMKKIPPSLWIYSGNGIYPIWLIENAFASGCLPLWNKLMNVIHEELEKYGADSGSVEASHVLRLAGSNNTKTNKKAKIIKDMLNFNPKRYTLTELSDAILYKLKYNKDEWEEIKKKNKKNKQEKELCKITSIFNLHTLNHARMHDIEKLIELREGNCKGTRERMVFLYRYWANCFHKSDETALEEALEINDMFTEPLSEAEVLEATENAAEAAVLWEEKLNEYWKLDNKPSVKKFFYEGRSGVYIYSNKKLIELLGITQEEMKHLATIINYEEKLRRKNEKRRQARLNENGLNSRQQAKVDKILLVAELLEKGLKNKDIVEKLNLTKGTVSKYSKEYLNNKEYYLTFKNNELESIKVIEFTRVTDTELKLIVV